MKLKVKWIVGGLVVLLVAGGLARTLASRASAKQALQAQLDMQKQAPTVELGGNDTVQVQAATLNQVLPISGPLKAVHSAFVKVRVAGELQGLTLREGDSVKAGQVIGRVDTTEYQARVQQAQQQAESAKAQVEIAQRTLDNNQSLVNQGFISKSALDTSLNNLTSAQATYRAAQAGADVARKSLDDTVLRAPIDGQISQRLAQNGERVAVDAHVVEIVDVRALELEAPLSAADSVNVKVGQSAQLSVEGMSQAVPAKVARINPSTVSGSRAVLIYLTLDATPGLRQGLFAQGSLALGTVEALAVPLDAVRTDKPQPYVQQVLNGQVAHQQVTLGVSGERDGLPMVEVKGLAAGSEVLMGSVGALRAGTLVTRGKTTEAAQAPKPQASQP
jgi:RND family efflux transporter MFP subunit